MNDHLILPWLEISIGVPLLGAIVLAGRRNPVVARNWALIFAGLSLLSAIGAWQNFTVLHARSAAVHHVDEPGGWMTKVFGRELLEVDDLSAPLLPLVALLYFLTTAATLRTKIRRVSFSLTLAAEAISMATFCCKEREHWLLIVLLAAGCIPPYLELRARGKPTRVYVLHMAAFLMLLAGGWSFLETEGRTHTLAALIPLMLAVFIRSGIAPFHCWMTDLFEHAGFGTSLLFVTPLVGAYLAIRLLLPVAPDWVLRSVALVSLITAVYAAGMALVQREARRFFCYLFISHSALVLVGLEMVTPIGLTGALCLWLSIGLSLGGFGLTIRSLEARSGRLLLSDYHGLYDHTPTHAVCFLLTGLASVGFPGTAGFIGTELLVDGAVHLYPYIGFAVVIAAALNGIAVVHAYFILFTGTRHSSTVSLQIGNRERLAVFALAALILAGGIFPQWGVQQRHDAAEFLLKERAAVIGEPPPESPPCGALARSRALVRFIPSGRRL